MQTITPKDLSSLLQKSPDTIELIDVRGTGEYDEVHVQEARNIPLHILPFKIHEINSTKQVIFICRSGGRSSQACAFAEKSNIQAYNLTGGMNSYEEEFPSGVVRGEKKKLFGLF